MMEHIGTLTNSRGFTYELWTYTEQGNPVYNLIKKGELPTRSGYLDLAYILKMKGF